MSHFILLKGRSSFELPQGHYRVEAYRGIFYTPATEEFDLRAGEARRVSLNLADWTGGASKDWISGDDHIHLTRSRQDDAVFLQWLEAEDLDVGNFLQLQRQMDAAVQYAFGPQGEARHAAYSIRHCRSAGAILPGLSGWAGPGAVREKVHRNAARKGPVLSVSGFVRQQLRRGEPLRTITFPSDGTMATL